MDIHQLSSNDGAFCAVTRGGRMVCWGDLPVLGEPWQELTQVVEVVACEGGSAAGEAQSQEHIRCIMEILAQFLGVHGVLFRYS